MKQLKSTKPIHYFTIAYAVLYILFIISGSFNGAYPDLNSEGIFVYLLFILFLVGFAISWSNKILTGVIFLIWYGGMLILELLVVEKDGGFGIISGIPLLILGIFFIINGFKSKKEINMKKTAILFSISIISIIIIISSCKNNDDPDPAEKKKYAWVTGDTASTGYGTILFTPDAGDTWERQGDDLDALQGINVSDIWAVDENNVWACGSGNSILRTVDAGLLWTRVQAPANLPNADLSSIFIVNKTNIWIAGGNNPGIVYSSIDNGSTWNMLDSTFFHNTRLQGIWAINTEKIYVVGALNTRSAARGFIGYTLDGGATWDSITPANDYNKWEWIGVVSSGNTIVIYGSTAHYMYSNDEGQTWKNDSVPDTGGGGTGGADINDLIMLDSQTWWGAFDMGNIFITTDGGTTWTKQETPGVGATFLVGIDKWDSQLALVVGYGFSYPPISPIIKTTNGGTLWEEKHHSSTQYWKVSFIKD